MASASYRAWRVASTPPRIAPACKAAPLRCWPAATNASIRPSTLTFSKRCSPKARRRLGNAADRGARAGDSPRRNRLISGLSVGVIIIEAARRSGSLITARLAGEQGREVFAVPGSPLDPRAEGTNGLLKQGATMVTETKDVIDALAPILGRGFDLPVEEPARDDPVPAGEPSDDERGRIVGLLGPSPC